MDVDRFHTHLSLGPVQLNVHNRVKMLAFYHDVMGLDVLEDDDTHIVFGIQKTPLFDLHEGSHFPAPSIGEAGLYHSAVLFSSQHDLAVMVKRILDRTPHLFQGSADHLVSEAFYFQDPEGNGIELYYDRDRSLWQWHDGHVQMASLYIDPHAYIAEHAQPMSSKTEIVMGHFHLKVGDIDTAKHFYHEILGFDVTASLPGALFLSLHGYHHHIGLNVWESAGAAPRNESRGLKQIEFVFTDLEDIEALKERLTTHNLPYEEIANGIIVQDPWKNSIRIRQS